MVWQTHMANHEVFRLRQDPIAFAVFELRFQGNATGVADLLPGMLYSGLKDVFPNIGSTQAAEIPLAVRQQMPDWEFVATKQMAGSGINLNFSQRSLMVEVFRPYPGWEFFRARIIQVLQAVFATGLIDKYERYSLRYANILGQQFLHDLSELNVEIKLDGKDVAKKGLQLRSEIDNDGRRVIVSLATDASLTITNSGALHPLVGTAVDIDVLAVGDASTFIDDYAEKIDALHRIEKEVFFGLLSDAVLNRLGPESEGGGAK